MSDSTPDAPRPRKKGSGKGATRPVLPVGVMAGDDAGAPAATDPAGQPDEPVKPVPIAGGASTSIDEAPDGVEPTATLRLERGGIAEATAGQVEVRMGGIGALSAEDVFVEWGGVGAARADRLAVEFGSVGAMLAGEARVTQGFVGSIAAREATLEQGIVRTMLAQRVVINRPSAVLVMIAQHVSGDIRPLLDWRGALAAGAAFGLVTALFRIARGRD
jgi:hypothetical protein